MKKPKQNKRQQLDFSTMDVDKFLENIDVLSNSEDENEEMDELPELPTTVTAKKSSKKSKTMNEKLSDNKKDVKIKNAKKKEKLKKNSDMPQEKLVSQDEKNKQKSEKKSETKKLKKQKENEDQKDVREIKKKMSKKEADTESDSETEVEDELKHKKDLKRLKDIDPEFYQFLEQNDKKLLKFGADLDANESSDAEEESSDGEKEEKSDDEGDVHQSEKDDLEVASDESDFEPEDGQKRSNDSIITLKMLKEWESQLKSDKISLEILKISTQAFNSALLSISGDSTKKGKFIVEGSAVFNGVLQLCILNFEPALKRYLGIKENNMKNISKCKKFKKVTSLLRIYLLDVANLLENVTSNNILTILLKHLHQLTSVLPAFQTITKPVLKRLVKLWSSSGETIRILAFLCILKITRLQQQKYLDVVLKVMYLSYVQNSKFVSPSTLPNINFMRRSLTEMFALDLPTSYKYAFLYIRQLAIHLRNAVTLQKKESRQAVYNWQYINSLRLWVSVLSVTSNKPQLQPLIYPLVSVITGVIKLIPSAANFPLRFHCCKMLADLSHETRTFIPILPFVLETLNSTTFNAKHKKLSMKPLKFVCVLRLSESQLEENAFRNEVLDQVYGLTLQILAQESHSIAFPDLVVMPLTTLKSYIKTSNNPTYSKKLKELVDKIQENANFMEKERNLVNFSLKDYQVIAGWEANIKNKGTPLMKFYAEWVKTTEKRKRKEAADTDTINAYDLPTIQKPTKRKAVTDEGPVDLFPSSESEDELEVEKPLPKKQKTVKKMKEKQTKPIVNEDENIDDTNAVDIVEDFNIDDW